MKSLSYIDSFARVQGISEGFAPIDHVEIDSAAYRTLETRIAYHKLNALGTIKTYYKYLKKEISRQELLSAAGDDVTDSVINLGVGAKNNITFTLTEANLGLFRSARQPESSPFLTTTTLKNGRE